MRRPEQVEWELTNERNKANVRWLLIVVIAPYLTYRLLAGQSSQPGSSPLFSQATILSLIIFSVSANLALTLMIARSRRTERFHPSIKYLTMIMDLTIVSALLLPTGGSASMFFVVYFVVLVSNALRYGTRMAIATILALNLMYVAVLSVQYFPQEVPDDLQNEILKVAGFWLVGLYAGYLSRRFELLRGEVERYQKLLAAALPDEKP